MADLLKTGISGLLATQRAIATASHNIANVNTEGFSRQQVHFGTRPADHYHSGYIGNGVNVSSVERIQSEFLQTGLQQATSDEARVSTLHEMMSRIDVMLSDENSGLASLHTEFFNSLQDLNTNPTSVGARQALLNSAENLTDRFNGMQGQFDALQSETNSRINSVITDINALAQNIAELNVKIIQSGNNPPNDLLDQRDKHFTDLAALVSIDTVAMNDGSVSVFIGNGVNLVSRDTTATLAEVPDPEQPEKSQVILRSSNGDRVIDEQIAGGTLGGLMDFRRELDSSMNQLGRLSIILADRFNEQHLQGLTIEGDRGEDFFTMPAADVVANDNNSGTASVAASFVDTSQLTTSDYRLEYDGASYTVTRLSDNQTVSGAGPIIMDGLQFDITGTANAGDNFLIRPTRKAARDIGIELGNINEIALSSPIRSEGPISNLGTGEITAPTIIDSSDPALTETVEIRFNNPPTTFDVVNTDSGSTLASGLTYTKGDNIEYQGWRVAISGEPEAGDLFLIEFNADGTGNNRNGQALAELQSALLVDGTSNLLDGYGSFVSKVGSSTRQAKINGEAMSSLLQDAQYSRESVSGVNLDEEAINLTRLQQSYQASAQVISAAENMFQILINAVGR